jgi:hypothetical protein
MSSSALKGHNMPAQGKRQRRPIRIKLRNE